MGTDDGDKEAEEAVTFPDSVVSVERALRIVELLTEEEDGLTLTEIAMRLEVNKAIASKLLQTLEKCDYVFRHGGIFQPVSQRPRLADDEWAAYGRKITRLAEKFADFGVRMSFHHHMGTFVETDDEVDRSGIIPARRPTPTPFTSRSARW